MSRSRFMDNLARDFELRIVQFFRPNFMTWRYTICGVLGRTSDCNIAIRRKIRLRQTWSITDVWICKEIHSLMLSEFINYFPVAVLVPQNCCNFETFDVMTVTHILDYMGKPIQKKTPSHTQLLLVISGFICKVKQTKGIWRWIAYTTRKRVILVRSVVNMRVLDKKDRMD